jgi:hypothetical protein
MSDEKHHPFLDNLFFKRPLYETTELPDVSILKSLFAPANNLHRNTYTVTEGYCNQCKKLNTFFIRRPDRLQMVNPSIEDLYRDCLNVELYCVQNHSHKMFFCFNIKEDCITKIGQLPSMADLSISEIKKFTKVLSKVDVHELNKAIGLNSHGVGIGSLVYLRRIIERLVIQRFEELKTEKNWEQNDFNRFKMVDKIDFLKDDLPEILVGNKHIYGILSKGIHELSEDHCLTAFEPLKAIILMILEEDLAKREHEKAKQKAIKELDAFAAMAKKKEHN